MSTSLAVELKEGRRQQELASPEVEIALASLARDLSSGRAGRAAALMAVVLAYRAGPKLVCGPVLLDFLAPALLAALQRLQPIPPVMDAEDLRQQLVLEVLRAAADMPLPANPSYLKRGLVARANQGVRRWLEREGRRQRRQRSFETLEEEGRG